MRKGKELQGLAVVDIGTGTKLGSVDEPIVSLSDGRIVGVMVKGGSGGRRGYVAAGDIRSIGTDAVTVASGDVLHDEADLDEATREAWEARKHLVGNKVMTEGGSLLGTVSDYYVDEHAARVAGLTIGGGLLSSEDALAADRVVSVGPDAIVVREEAGEGHDAPEGGATGWAGR